MIRFERCLQICIVLLFTGVMWSVKPEDVLPSRESMPLHQVNLVNLQGSGGCWESAGTMCPQYNADCVCAGPTDDCSVHQELAAFTSPGDTISGVAPHTPGENGGYSSYSSGTSLCTQYMNCVSPCEYRSSGNVWTCSKENAMRYSVESQYVTPDTNSECDVSASLQPSADWLHQQSIASANGIGTRLFAKGTN